MRSAVLFLLPAALFAQTADTTWFRVVMLPANEVPALNTATRGTADLLVSVVRDSSGQIVSGSVDFQVKVTFAATTSAIGLDIYSGPAGQKGTAMIGGVYSTTSTRPIQTNGDTIHFAVPVSSDNAMGLSALKGMLAAPAGYYLNLLTTDLPNGAIRGQLQRAQFTVLMAVMNSDKVTPAPANDGAFGFAQVVAIGTQDASGNWTSGQVYVTAIDYTSDGTPFNGFHIHVGAPGTIGPIGLTAILPAGQTPDPLGYAALVPSATEATITNATQLGTFANLFANPGALYVDVHTTGNPLGILRGQLRTTDSMAFPLTLDSRNEVKPPTVQTVAPSNFTVYTLRNEDGSVAAGTVLSDVNYRFPGQEQILGLYLRDGPPKVDGPIAMKLGGDFHSDNGFGNFFNWSLPVSNLAALDDTIKNPENHYINLHTTDSPGGAVRAQVGPATSSPVRIDRVMPADLDPNATEIGVGGLVSIFGANLARVATSLRGWAGQTLPVSLNGASVMIGGKPAPLLYVSPGQINAQVPVELAPGAQRVVVANSGGTSAAFTINIAAVAPAIFFNPVAAVLKNSNYSLVTSSNPAKAGDLILIYCTGLGRTSPFVATGVLVPATGLAQTSPLTVTIGGKPAPVYYSIATPQSAGLYQVAVTVPAGVSGNVPLVIQQTGVDSNSVSITVQ